MAIQIKESQGLVILILEIISIISFSVAGGINIELRLEFLSNLSNDS